MTGGAVLEKAPQQHAGPGLKENPDIYMMSTPGLLPDLLLLPDSRAAQADAAQRLKELPNVRIHFSFLGAFNHLADTLPPELAGRQAAWLAGLASGGHVEMYVHHGPATRILGRHAFYGLTKEAEYPHGVNLENSRTRTFEFRMTEGRCPVTERLLGVAASKGVVKGYDAGLLISQAHVALWENKWPAFRRRHRFGRWLNR